MWCRYLTSAKGAKAGNLVFTSLPRRLRLGWLVDWLIPSKVSSVLLCQVGRGHSLQWIQRQAKDRWVQRAHERLYRWIRERAKRLDFWTFLPSFLGRKNEEEADLLFDQRFQRIGVADLSWCLKIYDFLYWTLCFSSWRVPLQCHRSRAAFKLKQLDVRFSILTRPTLQQWKAEIRATKRCQKKSDKIL